MKELTMDEMIKACEAKKTDFEKICFALGTGRIIPKLGWKKRMNETMDYIKSLDGFYGVYPVDLWHTLLIFDTLNHAKAAKNMLKFKKVPVGNVIPILVPINTDLYRKDGKSSCK